MIEALLVFLIIFGMGVSAEAATFAIRTRNPVWYAMSALLPFLYSLLAVFLLSWIDGRRPSISAAVFFGLIFLAVGWLHAWDDHRKQHQAKLIQLADAERHVIDDQSTIDEWQRIVTALERDGHSATEAKSFLEGLEQSKAEYLARCDRLLKELEQYGGRA